MSKDVIDLLEKKLTLIAEENLSLTKERDLLSAKVTVLEAENSSLREQITNLQEEPTDSNPRPDGFNDVTDKLIATMFNASREVSEEEMCRVFGLPLGVIRFHFDLLRRSGMVQQTRAAMGSVIGPGLPAEYDMTPTGREYAMKLFGS
ncbi:MAG: hypothetical protein AAGC74_01650 [Verrucomicrobiota bacterium]